MLYFLTTPIGNLKDITINALEIFNICDTILCEDTRVTKKLLNLLSNDPFISANFKNLQNKKFISFHSHNEDTFLDSINIDFFNKDIIFCTDAGMPCISDPGAKLVEFARKNNIKYEIFNGGNAFSLAYAYSALNGAFKFISFLPHKNDKKIQVLKELKSDLENTHIIFYESPHRLVDTLDKINKVLPETQIYAYKELTKMFFREYIGRAKDILKELPDSIKGEWCLILKSSKDQNQNLLILNKDDILNLDISNKIKSKLLSKITDINPKEWYTRLENNKT